MIIYGSKAVHLQSGELIHHCCPSCGTKGSLVMSVFRKHAHIYWIPLFPFGKVTVAQCQHCQLVLEEKNMPEPLWEVRRTFKETSKGPIWQFAGLFLLGFFMLWGSRSSSQERNANLEKIKNPMVGDLYTYMPSPSNYSTMKVVEVSTDSIFVVRNILSVNQLSGIAKISSMNTNTSIGEQEGIARTEIIQQFNTNKILDIVRK